MVDEQLPTATESHDDARARHDAVPDAVRRALPPEVSDLTQPDQFHIRGTGGRKN